MPKFTNISTGDRGLYTADGLIMVPAGATVDVDIAANEEPNEEWFSEGEGGLSGLTVKELKALASEEAIDLGDASSKADIVAAIELARENAN